jgi:uncharacterized membrane protein
MTNRKPKLQSCQICHRAVPESQALPGAAVRPTIVEEIVREHPDWSNDGWICRDDLRRYRVNRVEAVLESERGELTELDREIVAAISRHETLATDIEAEFEQKKTLGEAAADHIGSFGGSWAFLGTFAAFLAIWIGVNVVAVLAKPFDPYPFIFLNLVLSMLAAIQAPLIMMSQNRQEAKDRLRAMHDYRVNLKAELEIRQLHEKVDHLLTTQWQRLVEIQQVQIDLLGELSRQSGDKDPGSGGHLKE